MENSPLRWVEPLKRWRRLVVKMLFVIPGMNPLAERLYNASLAKFQVQVQVQVHQLQIQTMVMIINARTTY